MLSSIYSTMKSSGSSSIPSPKGASKKMWSYTFLLRLAFLLLVVEVGNQIMFSMYEDEIQLEHSATLEGTGILPLTKATVVSPPLPTKNPPLRYPPGRKYLVPQLKPSLGSHRPEADAIFAMATGYDIDDHLVVIGSLLESGYKGDIVLGIQRFKNCTAPLQAFLKYHSEHSNVVAYEIPACEMLEKHKYYQHPRCNLGYAYANPYNHMKRSPDRSGRHQSARKFRYEHYWIWSRNYSPHSRVALIDFRDLVFQANPFEHPSMTGDMSRTLYFYAEAAERRIIETDRFTGKLIEEWYGPGMIEAIGNQSVICSGVSVGGQVAMEQYLLLMIWDIDNLFGNTKGQGDQVHHNVIYYTGELGNQTGIDNVRVWQNFEGAVATLGYTYQQYYTTGQDVLLPDGSLAPIVHQYDRIKGMKQWFRQKKIKGWQAEAQRLTNHSMDFVPSKDKPY
eukprot:Nitzschia sp. Nitz4//scaffold18_size181773//107993//109416//NITZ4_001925-RA/size181773-snap-gene-0.263-mRNA-1//1//CDS//3329540041//9331//frame0